MMEYMRLRVDGSLGPLSDGPNPDRPLVVLLDGRDCSIEIPILMNIARVAFCNVQSSRLIHQKVLNEAVGVLMQDTLVLTKDDLKKFKALRIIVRIGSAVENIDVQAAGELGIAVCNLPFFGVEKLGDTIASIIHVMHRQPFTLSGMLKDGKISELDRVRQSAQRCARVRGGILGIVGLGRVGSAVALRAKAFGFKVIFYDRYLHEGDPIEEKLGVTRMDTLQNLLFESDVVSLHCTLNGYNHHLINEYALKQMQIGSRLVNTARRELVDETALASALRDGRIRAAVLDVRDNEPGNVLQGPLKGAPNLIWTQHTGLYSEPSCRKRLREMAALELRRAMVGRMRIPQALRNCVNKEYFMSGSSDSWAKGFPESLKGSNFAAAAGAADARPGHSTPPNNESVVNLPLNPALLRELDSDYESKSTFDDDSSLLSDSDSNSDCHHRLLLWRGFGSDSG